MFVLVGCEDKEDAKIRNEQKLPQGCKIIDLDYGDLKAAVVCEGRKTTTLLRSWNEITSIFISDANGQITQIPQTNHYSHISVQIDDN